MGTYEYTETTGDPRLLALAFFGTSAWGAFYFYAANQERLSSSVMRQVMSTIRDSPELNAALGDALRPEPVWWLNGDPVVNGAVRTRTFERMR